MALVEELRSRPDVLKALQAGASNRELERQFGGSHTIWHKVRKAEGLGDPRFLRSLTPVDERPTVTSNVELAALREELQTVRQELASVRGETLDEEPPKRAILQRWGARQEPKPANVERTVFLPDVHVPHQDDDAVRVALDFVQWFRPDWLFILGDFYDCAQISKYPKDPRDTTQFQHHLDIGHFLLEEFSHAAGADCRKVFVAGNHEARLTKYAWDHPELFSLRDLRPQVLFATERLGWEFVPYGEHWDHHGFIVTHGNIVRKYSGYTARGMFEKYGVSGISGHTHRASMFRHANAAADDHAWFECGCLADLKPSYANGPVDWQHALGVGEFQRETKRFNVSIVNMPERKLLYQGMLFE